MYHFRRGIFLHKRQFYSSFADGHLYTDLQQNVQHMDQDHEQRVFNCAFTEAVNEGLECVVW